jgi:RecG-like helicase
VSPAHLTSDTPVKLLNGVGERRAELLRKIGIVTALDLLHHGPYRYEDASTARDLLGA